MPRVLLSIGVIQVLIILTGMVRAKILSLLLGPAGFGIIATIDQVVLTVVQIAGFGIPFFSLKFMSRGHSESKQRFQAVYSSFLSGLFVLSIFTSLLVVGLTYLNPGIFGADLVPYKMFLIIALFNVPALMLGIFFVHTLAAAQLTSASASLNLVVTFCFALATCAAAWTVGIEGIYIFVVLSGLLTTSGTVVYIRKRLALRIFDKSAGILNELRRSPEIISFSLYGHLALSAFSITMLVARYQVFSAMGEIHAGYLQALFGIALAIGAISGPMNTLYLTPIMNRTIPVGEKLDAAHNFQMFMTIIIFIMAVPFLLFPKLAVSILYSSEFLPACDYLYLFVFWQSLYLIVNVYQQLLIGLDDVRYFSVTTGVGYIVGIIVTPGLVSHYGISGAAFALITSVTCNGIFTAWRLHRKFKSAIPMNIRLRILFCLGGIFVSGMLSNRVEELSLSGLLYRMLFVLGISAIIWMLLPVNQKKILLDRLEQIRAVIR